jgi:hypothetical protein
MYIIQVNADTKDYESTATTASIRAALNDNMYNDATQHSWITLQHDAYPNTAAALPVIVADAKAKGYRFVDMDECLGYPVGTKSPTTPVPTPEPQPSATPTKAPTYDASCVPTWQPPIASFRCGASFGWAGCADPSEQCSEWQWCQENPANAQALPTLGQSWTAPLASGRCGASFGWAGCPAGRCCNHDSVCSSSCSAPQLLTGFACASTLAPTPLLPSPTKRPTHSEQCVPTWQSLLSSSRCGAGFGWAGCPAGTECSEWSWCGANSANPQVLPDVTQSWTPPAPSGRCGASFGFAGCPSGQCCDENSLCKSTCANTQVLNGFACGPDPSTTKAPTPTGGCTPGWQSELPSLRCGASFGWAGCAPGEWCSEWGWCSVSTPIINNQALPALDQDWGAPLLSGRCGASFGFAGCPPGSCCDESSFCTTTCANVQLLGGYVCL